MKKMICLLLAVLMILGISGCSQEPEIDENIISQIYEASGGSSVDDEIAKALNHANVISPYPRSIIEKTPGEKETVEIGGVKHEVSYKKTILQDTGCPKSHQYAIEGTNEGMVTLREDGTIIQLSDYPLPDIEVTPGEDAESVAEKVRTRISSWVDFSYYEKHSAVLYNYNEDSDGNIGLYILDYYNEVYTYTTEKVRITLKSDSKEKFQLNIAYSQIPKLTEKDLQISQTKEEKFVAMKCADMYNTEKSQYISYELDASGLAICKGEVCRVYQVRLTYMRKSDKNEEKALVDIYIPVRLLIEE